MKQHRTEHELSAAEQVLRQRLQTQAEPERAVQWQELASQLGPTARVKTSRRWSLWLAPVAIAATVAWLAVLQPQATVQPQPVASPMLLAGNYSLDSLDKQLQRAYLNGADNATIEALWQRRAALTAATTTALTTETSS